MPNIALSEARVQALEPRPCACHFHCAKLTCTIEHETAVCSRNRGTCVAVYRGADPANTIDRVHAAHCIPGPQGREPAHETGFGRFSPGWNEFPFSNREWILHSPSKGESLNPDRVAALESGLEGNRAAGDELASSQYRAMVGMTSEPGDQHRHAGWYRAGEPGERLLLFIEMLDYAAAVV